MVLHFENNGPFIGVVSLERIIEVSHWGNIAVEEHVHIKHIGVCVSVCVSGGGRCVSVCVCVCECVCEWRREMCECECVEGGDLCVRQRRYRRNTDD